MSHQDETRKQDRPFGARQWSTIGISALPAGWSNRYRAENGDAFHEPAARGAHHPVTTPPRPIEAAIQGLSGPVSVIEGAEAAALIATFKLDVYSREHRGANVHVDRVISKLKLLSAAHRAGAGTGCGTFRAVPAELVRSCGGKLTTRQASEVLGITTREVRKAIKDGRLRAERSGGRWLIDSADVARYRVN
jgi:excisionase family DNA binding protein